MHGIALIPLGDEIDETYVKERFHFCTSVEWCELRDMIRMIFTDGSSCAITVGNRTGLRDLVWAEALFHKVPVTSL